MYSRDSYIQEPLPIERELLQLFFEQSELVIFDIGSCEGEDTIRYRKLFPVAKIYSFEPLPMNISRIEDNLKAYSVSGVQVAQLALSNAVGVAEFHVSSGKPEQVIVDQDWDYGNKSSSLLEPDSHRHYFPWCEFNEVIKVKTDTIKNYCQQENVLGIDLVHMDVQGAELMVLNGASDFVYNVKAIWMEVESVSLYKNQPLKQDCEEYMRTRGFFKIKDTVNSVSGDQLYINTRYINSRFGRFILAKANFNILRNLLMKNIGKLSQQRVQF